MLSLFMLSRLRTASLRLRSVIIARCVPFCSGIVRAVTLEYQRQTGEKVKRQQIGQWLDPAPDQRTEPLLATGIALAKACKVVLKRHEEKPFPKRKAAR